MKDISQLLEKYSLPGPRYTSYPTAPAFQEGFSEADYYRVLDRSNQENHPLSLYFHIPFCKSVCYFCACNVIYTKRQDRADHYLEYLFKEIEKIGGELTPERRVEQLHFGGGTPTFLTPDQLTHLWEKITAHFTLSADAEISIELDPRSATDEHVETLANCGFNRASLGVQDVQESVQRAINRVQPFELSANLIRSLREKNFQSINVDLIYGLPLQTQDSFRETLERTLELKPDRFSLFNFAFLPELKRHQKLIKTEDMPDTTTRLEIFQSATDILSQAGYVYIGMDHFALPEDQLAQAQAKGELHRNFQGYTTRGDCDLIGLGISSIGSVSSTYIQNQKTNKDYEALIDEDRLPLWRGLELNKDDILRRDVINSIICNFQLNRKQIEKKHDINFAEYFAKELPGLEPFIEDGLVIETSEGFEVSERGRFVVRNICMLFDVYLQNMRERAFSKTV